MQGYSCQDSCVPSVASGKAERAGGLESGSKPSLGQGGLGSCDHAGLALLNLMHLYRCLEG